MSDEAKERYPFAMALTETLRTYQHINTQLSEDIGTLTAKTKKSIQVAFAKAFNKHIKWDSESLEQYVKDLSKKVYYLQDQVSDLLVKIEAIDKEMDKLNQCMYSYSNFEVILRKIQEIVDEMNLAEYSNLSVWTARLDKKVEQVLLGRLSKALSIWINVHCLSQSKVEEKTNPSLTGDVGHSYDEECDDVNADDVNAILKLSQNIVIGIVLRNRTLTVDPPLALVRSLLIEQFQNTVNIIVKQKRIQSSVYDDAFRTNSETHDVGQTIRDRNNAQMYCNLASMAKESIIYSVYEEIEKCVKAAGAYCLMWLQYQTLWDIHPDVVVKSVGDKIDNWIQVLEEIRSSRETFESSEYEKDFGIVKVNYKSVQSKVGDKYDIWHRDMLSRFGGILQEKMSQLYKESSSIRSELEKITLDGDINEIVAFISTVRSAETKKDIWEKELKSFQSSHRLLVGQRYSFPEDWLYIDNLEGEWDAFNQILIKKVAIMEERIPELQRRILQENRRIESEIKELETSWKKERNENVIVAKEPSAALGILSLFDTQVQRLKS